MYILKYMARNTCLINTCSYFFSLCLPYPLCLKMGQDRAGENLEQKGPLGIYEECPLGGLSLANKLSRHRLPNPRVSALGTHTAHSLHLRKLKAGLVFLV